jgi:hypothetical protein
VQHDRGDGRCLVASALAAPMESRFASPWAHGLRRQTLRIQVFDTKFFASRSSDPSLRHQDSSALRIDRLPEASVTVIRADDRSTLKCMVGMSLKRERFAAASYSICALLAEVSASPPITSLFSITKYYMVNKFLIVSVTNRHWIICTR